MLYNDLPIKYSEEDLLERSTFAKATARSLINIQESGTFTVGLYGKWGTGKTSLLNMILQEIKTIESSKPSDQEMIIVRFEPWNFANTDQLLSQFFVRLINEFYSASDKSLQKISNAFEKYLLSLTSFTKLIPYVGEQINEIAHNSFSLFKRKATKGASETDVLWQKDNVINILKKANRRLLIVIDDIDRLSNDQIRCIFQLVSSMANFPQTTYLLAFDKEIVTKALEDVQKGSGEEYLEKIIQIPIQIPTLWPNKIEEILFNRLDSIIREHPELQFHKQYWDRQYPSCIKPFIKTLRDINRLCNAVRFKIQGIAGDVDFADIVSITIIEMEFPVIYDWIISNKTLITGGIDANYLISTQWKKKEWEHLTIDQWKQLLDNEPIHKDIRALEKVVDAVTHLFPFVGEKLEEFHVRINPIGYQTLRSENHIAHPEKFDRYFEFRLNNSTISRSELLLLMNGLDEEGAIRFIKEKNAKGVTKEILQEIQAHCIELTPDRATIIARSLTIAAEFFDDTNSDLFYFGDQTMTEHLLLSVFQQIPAQNRFSIIVDLMKNADVGLLDIIARLLNTTELAYGRLVTNEERTDIARLVSLDELIQWEQLFINQAKQVLPIQNQFVFSDKREILYLLDLLDEEYTLNFMQKVFVEPINIVNYLSLTVSKWTGNSILYEVQDRYKKYISEEQILNAIDICKRDASLFSLDKHAQLMCAVFYLYHRKEFSEARRISAEAAQNILDEWKTKET